LKERNKQTKSKLGKVVTVPTSASCHEYVWRRGCIVPRFHNFDARWR